MVVEMARLPAQALSALVRVISDQGRRPIGSGQHQSPANGRSKTAASRFRVPGAPRPPSFAPGQIALALACNKNGSAQIHEQLDRGGQTDGAWRVNLLVNENFPHLLLRSSKSARCHFPVGLRDKRFPQPGLLSRSGKNLAR